MAPPLRIGLFPYLNVQPLVFGLRDETDFEMVLDIPSRIADLFREGKLDLAMVPSFEAATLGASVLDALCISSDGPVETVLLHHRTPLDNVKTVAMDEASRTSATLSKILIAQSSGQLPVTSSYPAKALNAPDADAILVIGDPAFRFTRPGFEPLDLGAAWKTQEGLPFVFAVMVAGERAMAVPHLGQRLTTANAKGLEAASTIARSYNSGVDAARAERYLRSVIRYDLGPREKEGLTRFYALAQSIGLLKDVKELQFHAI